MRWQDYVLAFLPGGLAILRTRLMQRDANDTGADDAAARLIGDMSPIIPELIDGRVNDNTADKVFLATYRTSEAYLRGRGKLPLQVV